MDGAAMQETDVEHEKEHDGNRRSIGLCKDFLARNHERVAWEDLRSGKLTAYVPVDWNSRIIPGDLGNSCCPFGSTKAQPNSCFM